MTNSNYYILLGSPEHLDFFENPAAYSDEQSYWTVPKSAKKGQEAFIYLCAPVSSIVGRVIIVEEPFFNVYTFPDWADNWMAEISIMQEYTSRKDLHIKNLKSLFPDWSWLRFPRNKTRIPSDIIVPFLELVEQAK